MQQIQEQFEKWNVVVLAVNMGDSAVKIKEYFEKEGLTFKPVRQNKSEISDAYRITSYPANYLVAPDGKIAARFLGFDDGEIRKALGKLLEKK